MAGGPWQFGEMMGWLRAGMDGRWDGAWREGAWWEGAWREEWCAARWCMEGWCIVG